MASDLVRHERSPFILSLSKDGWQARFDKLSTSGSEKP